MYEKLGQSFETLPEELWMAAAMTFSLSLIFSIAGVIVASGTLNATYLVVLAVLVLINVVVLVSNGLYYIYVYYVYDEGQSYLGKLDPKWLEIMAALNLVFCAAMGVIYLVGFLLYWFPVITSTVLVLTISAFTTMFCHKKYLERKKVVDSNQA